jgi:hypothetical protein
LQNDLPNPPPALALGELIDDRALEAADPDSFNHADFASELAGIVCSAKTPASIALFGPWGSGKSGIANLLKQRLPQDAKSARFVPFDASKYAEAPLRRYFISQVASALKLDDPKYHDGLYATTKTKKPKTEFRWKDWKPLVLALVGAVVLSIAALLVIAVIVAGASSGSFSKNWSGAVKDYLLTALPVAALIVAFFKLAADGFHITTHRSAPASDEEFEACFTDLVKEAKTSLLVVFIDELDRCSPTQVASVLETLKTFLFVHGCVFIVAADRQVLEQALRKRVRQHTPEDTSNPYYSAGSSYLDKVFQYQLSLPPLRSATLSRFALGLVENRPGVWSEIKGLDEVVPVLIPTHVVSPRRVKVLLNRFAIAYRLALTRAAEGRLDPEVSSRATELAKLVCLQAEFPLFAEDLTLDARLPDLVRMAAEREDLPASVSSDVAARARDYAAGRRVVAELLVEDDAALRGQIADPEEDDQEAQEPTGATEENGGELEGSGDTPASTQEPRQDRIEEVARRQAQQLVAYLRKTQHVPGPGPDLLYLESAGAGHGIDAVLADGLQRAANDNETDEVLALVARAASEGQGRGALLVLADVVREARPGLEGRNVVSVLLQSIERSGVDLGDAADSIADAVAAHLVRAELQPTDLLGALTLARSSSRAVAATLLEAVLRHPDAVRRPDVAAALVGHAAKVPPALRSHLLEATELALLTAPEQTAPQLLVLPTASAQALLKDVTDPIKTASAAHYAAAGAQKEGQPFEEAALLDPTPDEALAGVYDSVHDQPEDRPERRTAAAIAILSLMLHIDQLECRNAVIKRLPALAPISDKDLVGEVLAAVRRRSIPDWPVWLDQIEADMIGGDQSLQAAADGVAAKLWRDLSGNRFTDFDTVPAEADVDAAIAALSRVYEEVEVDDQIVAALEESLGVAYNSDEMAGFQDRVRPQIDKLISAGIVKHRTVADVELRATAATLRSDPPTVPATTIPDAIVLRVREAAPAAAPQMAQEVVVAAGEGKWLSDAGRADVQLLAAASALANDESVACPVTTEQLHALLPQRANEPDTVDEAISLKLAHFTDTAEEAWQLVEPLADDELPSRTRTALHVFARNLRGDDRFALIQPALERLLIRPVDRSFFEAARLSEVSPDDVAERLAALYRQAHSEEGWRGILNVWQQLGPMDSGPQTRLVDTVYIPLIMAGEPGLDLALSYFTLVTTVPAELKRRVIATLRKATQTDDQRRRVDTRLLEAKWRKKSLFGFGPIVDQTEE